jgi:hypothetical protein
MNRIILTCAPVEGVEFDVETGNVTPAKLLSRTVGKLTAGIAHFAFIKKDGSMREAIGTLKTNLMPPLEPKQLEDFSKKEQNPNLQTYFDLEAGAFRSFAIDRLIALF